MTRSLRIHIGRWLVAEVACVCVLVALLAQSTAVRVGLLCAAVPLAVIVVGRLRHRSLFTSAAIACAWIARSKRNRVGVGVSGTTVADDGGVVAVLELGPPEATVTTGRIMLPDLSRWPTLSRDGPAVHLQLLVLTAPILTAPTRALLALRATGDGGWHPSAPLAALESAVRRATTRLRGDGIDVRRLDTDELAAVTGAADVTTEAWDHLRVNGSVQIVVRVPLGAAGMTTEMVVRLAELPAVTTAVAWTADAATVRIDAPDHADVTAAVTQLARIGRLRRLDGEQIRGRRATLALAIDPAAPSESVALSLPPSGLPIGTDRAGNPLCIRIPAQRRGPIGITVVGGATAARNIAESAAAAGIDVTEPVAGVLSVRPGVPVRLDVLDHPTATDSTALRAADVVICQPLPAAEAATVSSALGLSAQTAAWLSRISPGMVAVIADGRVRWVVLPAQPEGVSALRRS